jgi:hypothetical protein
MSNVITGLAGLKAYQQQEKEKAAARERPKADWFSWPKGVDTVVVRFLNDWAEDSEAFAKNGSPLLAVEHQAPGNDGFKRRALCTADDGACYACERHALDYKEGWKQRTNLYINALVRFPDGKEQVLVMSRNANSTFVTDLIQELEDEKDISGANYRVKVSGEKTTTKWSLKRLAEEPLDVSTVEAFDLNETALRDVPYEKQADYYGAVYQGGASTGGSDVPAQAGSASPEEAAW